MKLCELFENVTAGAVSGGDIAGFRSSLFSEPLQRYQPVNQVPVVKEIRYSKKKKKKKKRDIA